MKGNIRLKRLGSAPMFIQGTDRPELFSFGADIADDSEGRLEPEKAVTVSNSVFFKQKSLNKS